MIDTKIIEQVRNKDMITFLQQNNGFSFVKHGGEYRSKQHQSLSIKADRLSWYWHSKGIGGYGALDYLMKVEGVGFREAVRQLSNIQLAVQNPVQQDNAPKKLILPEKAFIFNRLYAYLCKTRGIDSGIVHTLIQERKMYEDKKGNIVFVGYDERGKAKFACLRGTYSNNVFRMDCPRSDKRYGFNMTYSNSGKLYIFESPIDTMSHASLENIISGNKNAWRADNRLSLGGASDLALEKYLEIYSDIKELVFCLDNDDAGREAAANMVRDYTSKGYHTRTELPKGKDYNDDLLAYRATHLRKKQESYELSM